MVGVIKDGTRIPVHIDTRKDPWVLRTWDSPPQEPAYCRRQHQPWVDAEESDEKELKRIADGASGILAAALMRLGAV